MRPSEKEQNGNLSAYQSNNQSTKSNYAKRVLHQEHAKPVPI